MSRRRKLAVGLIAVLGAWVVVAVIPPSRRPVHAYHAGDDGRLLVIAHRGGAEVAPENTLPTFRQVAAMDVQVLEMDVRLSADGVLVIFHDRRLDRTTDGTGRVEELTLAELQALDAGYNWSPEGGQSHPYRGQGHRIPTFTEMLAAFPGRRILVELKTADPVAARQLCGDLRADGRESLAIVASFRDEALDEFRDACPDVATSASTFEFALDWALRTMRLDGLYEPNFDAYHVPVRFGPFDLVDRDFVERARARGLPVQVWTVDRVEEMERLIELGVDGIMTDRPDLLIELLTRQGPR